MKKIIIILAIMVVAIATAFVIMKNKNNQIDIPVDDSNNPKECCSCCEDDAEVCIELCCPCK